MLWAILTTPETAFADKPDKPPGGGGGDKNQDIPVCVVVDDQTIEPYAGVSSDVSQSGTNEYCDKKKDHISAFVGRTAGQFILNTNTNDNPTGRTMSLAFTERIVDLNPPGAPEHLFDITGTVMPIGVRIITGRGPNMSQAYVDLRAMEIGDSAFVALEIRLIVTNIQNAYYLNYGDAMWNPDYIDKWDDNMYLSDLVIVTREADDEDGKKVWTIQNNGADYAYLRRIMDNDYRNWIPVGIYSMPLSLTIKEK
jgi:hypothetical protein